MTDLQPQPHAGGIDQTPEQIPVPGQIVSMDVVSSYSDPGRLVYDEKTGTYVFLEPNIEFTDHHITHD